MKFGQIYSVRKNLTPEEFSRGIWNPQTNSWRDVLEDYLYISRKRINNKLCMFKLQVSILSDIVNNIKIIDSYKKLQKELAKDRENGKISKDEYDHEKEHINSEIFSSTLINKGLREIADGVVWKYFSFNRAILHMLANKPPIEIIRPDDGMINNLYEFADAFLNPDDIAIFNDITNFLRVGDVTQIKKDGSIDIIEVKSSKKRGRRITRQKQRMSELVEFFNTGITDYDGKKLKIIDSNIKQKNYLKSLYNAIQKAKYRGHESILIGNYMILEIVDYSKIDDSSDFISFFRSKHKSVKDEWSKRNDFVISHFFIDKLNYSKNCAPFSIFPFDIDTCTDIIMGRLGILSFLNYSEIFRLFEKSGWNIVDSLFSKSKEELSKLQGTDVEDVSFLKVKKSSLTFDVPPSLFARVRFELLSPKSFIDELDEIYQRGPQREYDYCLTNYLDEQSTWN